MKNRALLCIFSIVFMIEMGSAVGQQPNAISPFRTIHPDVVYGHKSGMALTYDVLVPASDKQNGAGVLFMVSGGWNSHWRDPERVVRQEPNGQKNLFEKLIDGGYTVYMVRHGSAPEFKVPDAVNDVRGAVRHIKFNAGKLGVDPKRIGVCGGSAGGHLSLVLGTTGTDGRENPADEKRVGTRVAAVVAYFPPTDLQSIVHDTDLVKRFPALDFDHALIDSVSPIKHVTADDAPTLLIHGDQDKLVKLAHSENIKKSFDAADVENELIVIKNAAHGFGGQDQQRAEQALLDWFDKYLAK